MAMMRWWGIFGLVLAFSLAPLCRAADDPDADALSSKGLVKSNSLFVLSSENDVVGGMRALRLNKAKMDVEVRQRLEFERKIKLAKDYIADAEARLNQLQEQIATATDVTIRNRLIRENNLLVVRVREAGREQKDMEEKSSKLGIALKADYVDQMMLLSAKADTINKSYTALAADDDVKATLDKINAAGKGHVKLGPSSPFLAAANQLRVWRKEIETESIPLFEEGGVNEVDVMLNGTIHRMILDSGSSGIVLPTELGAELNLTPGPKDRVVQMTIADGSTIEGHLMKLKSVRVGRFTMEDIECVVLNPTPNKAPALLGNTFLSHFVVKLDSKGGALYLTELSKDDKLVKTVAAPEKK